MSNPESLDEETKRLLAEVENDEAPPSSKDKSKKSYENKEDGIQWETNEKDDDDSQW